MNFQSIIVFIIIAFAAGYFGLNIWRKSKTFTKKSGGCGSDCGCEAKTNSE
ncbi:MAG: FeoB-associated Cys-rich membrane protein [Aridibacter sp.]